MQVWGSGEPCVLISFHYHHHLFLHHRHFLIYNFHHYHLGAGVGIWRAMCSDQTSRCKYGKQSSWLRGELCSPTFLSLSAGAHYNPYITSQVHVKEHILSPLWVDMFCTFKLGCCDNTLTADFDFKAWKVNPNISVDLLFDSHPFGIIWPVWGS